MKKVLLLCVALVLTACAQHQEESKNISFERGAVLSEASEKCSMEIMVKSGRDIIFKRNENCLESFVVNIGKNNQLVWSYQGSIAPSSNSDNITAKMVMLMFGEKMIGYSEMTTSRGDYIVMPQVPERDVIQYANLNPGKTYNISFEGLDFSIKMNK